MTDPILKAREKEIEKQRDALLVEKKQHETQLNTIKTIISTSGTMEHGKYQQYCKAQSKHVNAIAKINERLAPLKHELRELIVQDFEDRQVSIEVRAVETIKLKQTVQALVSMRDKYTHFAADHTRVSSMRQMSAEFVIDLNEVIKQAISKPEKEAVHV